MSAIAMSTWARPCGSWNWRFMTRRWPMTAWDWAAADAAEAVLRAALGPGANPVSYE